MLFNRCGIESLGPSKVLYFGLVRADGELVDACACTLTQLLLNDVKASWLEYIGKIGEVPSDTVNFDWRPPVSRIGGLFLANAAQIARSGKLAEIRFYCYSLGFAMDKQREATEKDQMVEPQPQALLMSDLDLHLSILVRLFDPDEAES